MMNIRKYGSSVLQENCFHKLVDTSSDLSNGLAGIVDDMFVTMRAHGGIGLAANQVGLPNPFFVWEYDGNQGVAINPQLEIGGTLIDAHREGCLSVPGIRVPVDRASKAKLTAYNLSGEEFTVEATGVLATIFQHEFDHLHGICIADHLNRKQRRALLKAYR